MVERGWDTSAVSEAIQLGTTGTLVNVAVGVIATQGGRQVALRVGDQDTVILPSGTAHELIVNLRQAMSYQTRGDPAPERVTPFGASDRMLLPRRRP